MQGPRLFTPALLPASRTRHKSFSSAVDESSVSSQSEGMGIDFGFQPLPSGRFPQSSVLVPKTCQDSWLEGEKCHLANTSPRNDLWKKEDRAAEDFLSGQKKGDSFKGGSGT